MVPRDDLNAQFLGSLGIRLWRKRASQISLFGEPEQPLCFFLHSLHRPIAALDLKQLFRVPALNVKLTFDKKLDSHAQ
jgi:hypothetical protein